jgi:hypothetical protein
MELVTDKRRACEDLVKWRERNGVLDDVERQRRVFTSLMLRGKIREAVRYVTQRAGAGV